MRIAAVVPAYQAEAKVGAVISGLVEVWPDPDAVFVVDDGSRDKTSHVASQAGARVLRHPENRGKGVALRTGLAVVAAEGFEAAVTVDADGQHPVAEALRVAHATGDASALVLGVRDLVVAGAPRKNRISNAISNGFLSLFSRRRLADTQCGLRRYPLPRTLELDGRDDGYAYEAEILLLAIAAGVPVVELPIQVDYPIDRTTHFDSVRDPARVIRRVVHVLARTRGITRAAQLGHGGGHGSGHGS